jgi:hypothetical protein
MKRAAREEGVYHRPMTPEELEQDTEVQTYWSCNCGDFWTPANTRYPVQEVLGKILSVLSGIELQLQKINNPLMDNKYPAEGKGPHRRLVISDLEWRYSQVKRSKKCACNHWSVGMCICTGSCDCHYTTDLERK